VGYSFHEGLFLSGGVVFPDYHSPKEQSSFSYLQSFLPRLRLVSPSTGGRSLITRLLKGISFAHKYFTHTFSGGCPARSLDVCGLSRSESGNDGENIHDCPPASFSSGAASFGSERFCRGRGDPAGKVSPSARISGCPATDPFPLPSGIPPVPLRRFPQFFHCIIPKHICWILRNQKIHGNFPKKPGEEESVLSSFNASAK